MDFYLNLKNFVISYDDIRHSKHSTVLKGEMTTTSRKTACYLSSATENVVVSRVALKELRDPSYFNEAGIANFLQRLHEYVAATQCLDHPNICKVIGLTHGHGPVPLLVLPYFPHHDIVGYLKKHSGKNDKDKIMLALPMLRGLAYLHENGVLHGCIHAGNTLVDENGRVVLSDTRLDALMFSDQQYFQIHPKYRWMPHERLIVDDTGADELALAPASMPADIYAAAITIAQFWTLCHPFPHIRNEFEFVMMLQKLTTDELESFALPEEVPPQVSAVLRSCLRDEPHARPSAETLLASFEALL